MRRLTIHPAQEGFPSWSPDGETIVFSFGGRDVEPGTTGLWKVPAAGGEPRQFTAFIGEHPDWSPDGHYIVFDADTGSSVQIVSSSGGQPIRIVPPSIPILHGGNPNWSPDASRIAFRAGSGLWVLDVRTGEADAVYEAEGMYPIPGCWSRDGSGVFVTVRDIESYESAIWWVAVSGGDAWQLTDHSDVQYRYVDLSPDGEMLAFTACEGRACDLWIMSSGGGEALRLTTHPAYDDTPRWSPDGRRIAFTSTRSGSFDVWLLEVDVEAARKALAELNE